MVSNGRKLIAVVGATGQQGGAVVRALQTSGQFKVRALTRNPGKHHELAEEVIEADLDRPETLKAAFVPSSQEVVTRKTPCAPCDRKLIAVVGATGQQGGTDEFKQATAAVRAAKDAGLKHLIWSTLPDVEAISGGSTFHTLPARPRLIG